MSMLLVQSGIVTPKCNRPSRPFGEGLTADLTIRGVVYHVEPFTGQDGTQVVRLSKQGGKGETYNVSRGDDAEVVCDCPDFEYSKIGTGQPCKHGRAVVEAGLLKATAPRIADPAPAVAPVKSEHCSEVAPVKSDNVSDSAPRPFGLVEPPTDNVIGGPPRQWSEAEWARAVYFHLNIPQGMRRPSAPTPVPAEIPRNCEEFTPAPTFEPSTPGAWDLTSIELAPAVEVPAETTPIGTIPPVVEVEPDDNQAWNLGNDDGVEGRPCEPSASWSPIVRHAYRMGHRNGSNPAFPPVRREPAPVTAPSREDAAYHFARTLGLDGEDAAPRAHWPATVRRAFLAGLAEGSAERDVREAEDMDRRWADCVDDRIELEEWAESRCLPC